MMLMLRSGVGNRPQKMTLLQLFPSRRIVTRENMTNDWSNEWWRVWGRCRARDLMAAHVGATNLPIAFGYAHAHGTRQGFWKGFALAFLGFTCAPIVMVVAEQAPGMHPVVRAALYTSAFGLMLAVLGYAGYMRGKLRARHGIPGTAGRDYSLWVCCAPCAACQELRTTLDIEEHAVDVPHRHTELVPPPPIFVEHDTAALCKNIA